jgi:hypothetical protein
VRAVFLSDLLALMVMVFYFRSRERYQFFLTRHTTVALVFNSKDIFSWSNDKGELQPLFTLHSSSEAGLSGEFCFFFSSQVVFSMFFLRIKELGAFEKKTEPGF